MIRPSTKPDKRKRCNHCRKRYVPKNSRQQYCTADCRKAANRKKLLSGKVCTGYKFHDCEEELLLTNKSDKCRTCKRISNRNAKFFKTGFGQRLLYDIRKRAGTVEIIQSLDGLTWLAGLQRQQSRYNTVVKGKSQLNYDIAHRVAVNDPQGRLGIYSEDNLVLVPRGLNRSMGAKAVYETSTHRRHYIWKSDLKSCWRVAKSASVAEVRSQLETYLGEPWLLWVDEMDFPKYTPKDGDWDYEGFASLEVAYYTAPWELASWITANNHYLIADREAARSMYAEYDDFEPDEFHYPAEFREKRDLELFLGNLDPVVTERAEKFFNYQLTGSIDDIDPLQDDYMGEDIIDVIDRLEQYNFRAEGVGLRDMQPAAPDVPVLDETMDLEWGW